MMDECTSEGVPVRGADGVPEGGAGHALVDVGHARRHLGLRRHVVLVHPHLQVTHQLILNFIK